jgi:hypothetical protein
LIDWLDVQGKQHWDIKKFDGKQDNTPFPLMIELGGDRGNREVGGNNGHGVRRISAQTTTINGL